MPAFINTLINPFINLFSYVGLPVQKIELNPFIDQEIPAVVREISDFQAEIPAKVIEIVDPNTNSNYKPWFNPIEHFDCEPEIPIVLLDKGQQTIIMRSSSGDGSGANDFHWESYKKVSEMRIKSEYGYEKTLEQIFAEVTQMKESNIPLRFRPIPFIIQGGLGVTSVKPVTNEQINNETQSHINRSSSNPCEDESAKTRPYFPVYASKLYGF